MGSHPVRLVVDDEDLRRSRLTTFFRFLLAIPHYVWLLLWSLAVLVAAPIQWLVAIVLGRPARGLHGFLSAYVRYTTQVYAYLLFAANPYPGFSGGPYPVDVELPGPEPQSRLKTLFRLLLALPALLISSALVGLSGGGGGGGSGDAEDVGAAGGAGLGAAFAVAFLAWFAILVRGRMPRGFRDFQAYALRYGAQTGAYLLFVTDRYPDASPDEPRLPGELPERAVRLVVTDDGRRSRLTVFFRLLLTLPHVVWLVLWGIAAFFAASVNWLVVLVRGRSPDALHRFLSAYLRYCVHVGSFLYVIANPFPGFTGAPGYPVDVELDPPARQRRLVTLFRLVLAIPAVVVSSALGLLVLSVAVLGWFASLALGRMPAGLRDAGAYVIGYSAQTYAYAVFVLTDRYPFSGPLPAAEPPAMEPVAVPEPAPAA